MKRSKPEPAPDQRAMNPNDWYVVRERGGQWSIAWLTARRRAVKSRREAWL